VKSAQNRNVIGQTAGRGVTRRVWCRRLLAFAGAGLLSSRAARRASAAGALPTVALPREAWDAAPPGPGMQRHTIERITLHHTGPPSWYGLPPAAAYLRAIQAFHQGPERRWPDIAYHLLVDLDGVIWQGRALEFAGDTATDYDPTGHALIAVLGEYDEQVPSAAQVEAVMALVAWLMDRFRLSTEALGGHRDYARTACPGHNLYALLDPLRAGLWPGGRAPLHDLRSSSEHRALTDRGAGPPGPRRA
jgi:hypothetical protein